MLDSSLPFRRWIRHTATVPKGLLRYYVLRMLKKRPMSGSEIMEEITDETDGRWKPSPGSVYPLLGWLQDNGFTKKIPSEETGMKRYTLTEKGEKFFQEQTNLKDRLERKLEYLVPQLLSGFWLSSNPEKLRRLREPTRRFIKALLNLRMAVDENPSEQALTKVGEFLNRTTEEIEGINRDIKEGKLS